VLLALDVYPLRRWTAGRERPQDILLEKLPFLILACGAMLLANLAMRSAGQVLTLAEHGIASRMMQAAYGLLFYLWKTLLPLNLSPLYPLRPDFDPAAPLYLLCALGFLSIAFTLIVLR